MFGIDRKTGGTINETAEGRKFWSLIDAKGASKINIANNTKVRSNKRFIEINET